MRDLGFDLTLIIESNSSSAKAFASRRGLGKERHVQTRNWWIQDMVAANSFSIKNIPTADYISNALTKAIDRKILDIHLKTLGSIEEEAVFTTNVTLKPS